MMGYATRTLAAPLPWLLASCAAQEAPPSSRPALQPSQVLIGRWSLEQLNSAPVQPRRVTMTFQTGGLYRAQVSCQEIDGYYSVRETSVHLERLRSTAKECTTPLPNERQISEAVTAAPWTIVVHSTNRIDLKGRDQLSLTRLPGNL